MTGPTALRHEALTSVYTTEAHPEHVGDCDECATSPQVVNLYAGVWLCRDCWGRLCAAELEAARVECEVSAEEGCAWCAAVVEVHRRADRVRELRLPGYFVRDAPTVALDGDPTVQGRYLPSPAALEVCPRCSGSNIKLSWVPEPSPYWSLRDPGELTGIVCYDCGTWTLVPDTGPAPVTKKARRRRTTV